MVRGKSIPLRSLPKRTPFRDLTQAGWTSRWEGWTTGNAGSWLGLRRSGP